MKIFQTRLYSWLFSEACHIVEGHVEMTYICMNLTFGDMDLTTLQIGVESRPIYTHLKNY